MWQVALCLLLIDGIFINPFNLDSVFHEAVGPSMTRAPLGLFGKERYGGHKLAEV